MHVLLRVYVTNVTYFFQVSAVDSSKHDDKEIFCRRKINQNACKTLFDNNNCRIR